MKVYFVRANKDVDVPYPAAWWESMACNKEVSCGAGCGGVVPSLCPAPIDVPFQTSTRETVISCILVQIISRQLFHVLEPHLTNVIVGKCVRYEDNAVISSHVTVYTLPGDGLYFDGRLPSKTRYHVCRSCGARYAHYCSAGYVVRRVSLRNRRAWLEGRHGVPVVDEELASRIAAMGLHNIRLSAMPVVD